MTYDRVIKDDWCTINHTGFHFVKGFSELKSKAQYNTEGGLRLLRVFQWFFVM